MIEERLGKPIERVFAEDGEAAFRAAEEEVTLELLNAPQPGVLALGGGAIGHERVRAALAEHLVIWLDVGLELAWARCQGSDRPLARERDQFEHLYHVREPIYAELADVIVPAERSHRDGPDPRRATTASRRHEAAVGGDRRQSGRRLPGVRRDGLLAEHGFWPPAVDGRRFLVTDGAVGQAVRRPRSGRSAGGWRSCPASSRRPSRTPRSCGPSWRGPG